MRQGARIILKSNEEPPRRARVEGMIRRLRLASGLVMFAYVTTHFVNHSLGLVSVQVMDRALEHIYHYWASLLGSVLLYGAFATHYSLALWALWLRRSLKMPFAEATQLILGFSIPFFLTDHVLQTRVADTFYGADVGYYSTVLHTYFVADPLRLRAVDADLGDPRLFRGRPAGHDDGRGSGLGRPARAGPSTRSTGGRRGHRSDGGVGALRLRGGAPCSAGRAARALALGAPARRRPPDLSKRPRGRDRARRVGIGGEPDRRHPARLRVRRPRALLHLPHQGRRTAGGGPAARARRGEGVAPRGRSARRAARLSASPARRSARDTAVAGHRPGQGRVRPPGLSARRRARDRDPVRRPQVLHSALRKEAALRFGIPPQSVLCRDRPCGRGSRRAD